MIYTFYSYKGGVGRSMALANVAEWFYEQGLRVIMIDWDLEAPGLESFFVSQEEIPKVRAKPGLLDMLLAYKDQYPLLPLTVSSTTAAAAASTGTTAGMLTSTFMDAGQMGSSPGVGVGEGSPAHAKMTTPEAIGVLEKHLAPLEYFLYPIRPPEREGQKGALWLLSAGWRSEDRFSEYGRAVQNFSWSQFYDSYHGEAYFEWMRKQLNSTKLADVVLIDSRTGLTEMGGVCTRQLADVVVSFTAPNVQNLTGVTAMTASFKKKQVLEARNDLEFGDAKRPLEVIVVPTRIDDSATQEFNNFKREFNEQPNEYPSSFRILKRTSWDLFIPYISKYAYGERLAIGDEGGNERLQEAYKNLAAHLVLLAPEGGVIRACFAAQLRDRFKLLPRVVLVDDDPGAPRDRPGLRAQLTEAGLTLWDNTGQGSELRDSLPTTGNIDLAEFLVLPVKHAEVRSESFKRQWRYARQLGVCVMLVRGDAADELTADDLPLWLRGSHIYDPVTEFDKLVEILKRPCITPRVPFMAPDLPESYVQRPLESRKLIKAILSSQSERVSTEEVSPSESSSADNQRPTEAVTRVALCGPGGVGKSALATAACAEEAVMAAFPDGILWVALGQTPDISAKLNLLYSSLTGEDKVTSQLNMERTLAAKLEGKKCLLVVNEVWDETDLQPFLNLLSNGALLFTTRNQNLAASAGAQRLVLGEMSSAESLELLVKHSGVSSGQEAVLNQIVKNLGNTPLPIKLAGAALKQRLSLEHSSPETTQSVCEETESRGVVAFDQKNTTDPDFSVAKSVALSLSRLSEPEKDAFLKLSSVDVDYGISLNELSNLWGKSDAETKSLVLRFASLSLLDYQAEKGTVQLHRAMHAFLVAQRVDPSILSASIEKAENVFSTLTPEEQLIARRVLARLIHLSRPGDVFADNRRSYDLERFDGAARPIIKTLAKAELLIVERATVQLADDSLVQGWHRLRQYLDDDRAFLLWRQTLEPKIAEWESSKRHNREVLLKGRELAEASSWLSKQREDLNESEKQFITEGERVEAYQKRASRRAAGVIVLVALVLVTSALWVHYRSQRIARETLKTLSDTRIDENANTPPELSEANYRKAIAAYDKVIKDNPQFAEAYDGRGSAYEALGNLEQAERDYQTAVELDENYAQAWKDLGAIRSRKGGFDSAIEAFNHAIKLRPDYADAYLGRGDTYASKTDYERAIADYTKYIAQLAPDKQTSDAYYKRGLAYKANGDSDHALDDFQTASQLPGKVLLEDILKNMQQLSALAPTAPRVLIQYNDPDDKDLIKQVAKDLKDEGFKVVGQPQLSASAAQGDGDVRSFNTKDRASAESIAKAVQGSLSKQGYNREIVSRPLTGYPNVPVGQIEIWIASLRNPSTLKSSPARAFDGTNIRKQ